MSDITPLHIFAPDCTTTDNKHVLMPCDIGPYFAQCSECNQRFYLIAEETMNELGLHPVERTIQVQ